VSDNAVHRPISGNLQSPWESRDKVCGSSGKRRLVEECEAVWVYAVQRAFGKKALIATICQARPFQLPVPGGYFDVWLVSEPHRLPGGRELWSSLREKTARLWLVCPRCRRKVAKLYYYDLAPGSSSRSDLLCRRCHGLTYQSVNCGGNRWYREVAASMKRLLREKDRLLTRRQLRGVAVRLVEIENEIRILEQKVKPETHRGTRNSLNRPAVRQRRAYRDLALLYQ
jgi:hypothetical protein